MASLAITVDIQAADALKMLANGERRIGYALVNSLNLTAKEVQEAERKHVAMAFQVRKSDFIMREAAIITFASMTRGNLQAEIRVGDKPRLLLSQFEAGGERTGFVGRNVAVPLTGGARPTKPSPVDPALTFSAMHMQEFRGGKRLARKMRGGHTRGYGVFGEYGRLELPVTNYGGKSTWKGQSRTYLVPGVGVFQRTGPGATRLIWSFKPSVKIPANLHFLEIGRAVAEARFPGHLHDQVGEAFEHALKLSELLRL